MRCVGRPDFAVTFTSLLTEASKKINAPKYFISGVRPGFSSLLQLPGCSLLGVGSIGPGAVVGQRGSIGPGAVVGQRVHPDFASRFSRLVDGGK